MSAADTGEGGTTAGRTEIPGISTILLAVRTRCLRRDAAGDEGGLHFGDGVVDGESVAFVEDLDGVELGRGRGAQLIAGGDGDIEGRDLVRVPGQGLLLPAADGSQGSVVQLVDRGAGRRAEEISRVA